METYSKVRVYWDEPTANTLMRSIKRGDRVRVKEGYDGAGEVDGAGDHENQSARQVSGHNHVVVTLDRDSADRSVPRVGRDHQNRCAVLDGLQRIKPGDEEGTLRAIREKWERYKELPESEKKRLAEKAAKRSGKSGTAKPLGLAPKPKSVATSIQLDPPPPAAAPPASKRKAPGLRTRSDPPLPGLP